MYPTGTITLVWIQNLTGKQMAPTPLSADEFDSRGKREGKQQ